MKILSLCLVFVFLLSCTPSEQETKNPLAGTTWELSSGKWVRADTTFTFPNSPQDQWIIIYGKTHYSAVRQDTSQNNTYWILGKYVVDGDNSTATIKMSSVFEAIGSSFKSKFQIEEYQLMVKYSDYQFGGYIWKEAYEVWKRID